MSTANKKIITAGDMSGTLTSSSFDTTDLSLISVQAVYTGSPTGSLVVKGSNDGVNFTSLGASFTQAISAAGSVIWNLGQVGYTTIQAVYTFTSGTGSLTVIANGKG